MNRGRKGVLYLHERTMKIDIPTALFCQGAIKQFGNVIKTKCQGLGDCLMGFK